MYGNDGLVTSFLPFFVLSSLDKRAFLRQIWVFLAIFVHSPADHWILKKLSNPVCSKTLRIYSLAPVIDTLPP